MFTASDFPPVLTVQYAAPVPEIDWQGNSTTTLTDYAVLEIPRVATPGSIPVQRVLDNGKGIVVTTDFLWPDEPPTAGGYTAPLLRFERTVITGLTGSPIVLTGFFSQTYRPGHHNFTEEFIFEPALEPGSSPAVLAELQAANIQYIHLQAGMGTPVVTAASPAGVLRKL